jgi:hypothetical protein
MDTDCAFWGTKCIIVSRDYLEILYLIIFQYSGYKIQVSLHSDKNKG